jgi:hypothetical protein
MGKATQSSTPGDNELGQQIVPDQENIPVEFIEDESNLEGDYIQYTGGASIRQITRREWEQAGIGRQPGVEWTVSNRHLVPLNEFSDAARERVLKEPGFRLVNAADVP